MRLMRSALVKPIAPLVALGASLWLATPAFAHIHTDPPAVEAGTSATVGFIVEHGCGGSPTTSLDIQLPDGSKDATGVDGDGFTTSVKDNVVTFAGGSLGPDTAKTFKVTFTPPATAGDVPVKIVQTCEKGSLDWIEVAQAGQPEPEHPAPLLKLTEGAPTAADESPEPDHDATGSTSNDHEATGGDHAAAGSDHEADGVARGAADHEHGAETAAEKDDDSSSETPLLIGIGAAVVVVGAGAALYLRSRRSGDAPVE